MRLCTSIVLLAALATSAVADEHEAPRPYIYATYMYCDLNGQERVDAIMESAMKPVYDQAVEDDEIISWGWLAHQTGGKWRRVLYYAAPDMEALLDAGAAINEELGELDEAEEFSAICHGHDDYIWRSVTGSGDSVVGAPRGNVGLSAYHVCDMTREGRADELVKKVIGPVFDAHTGEGKLTSWGWSQHYVGGQYRRLSTMTASDWPTLFAARDAIIAELADNALAAGFNEICGSHADYMWDIVHENP